MVLENRTGGSTMATERKKSVRTPKNGAALAQQLAEPVVAEAPPREMKPPAPVRKKAVTVSAYDLSAVSTTDPRREVPPEALREMIQTRAYEIWQEENCPSGKDEEHWLRAEAETLANSHMLRESLDRR